MLSDIAKIKIESDFFDDEGALFDFFSSQSEKMIKATLVYGRNGSGKSTIAKGFRVIKGEEISTITKAICYDEKGRLMNLENEEMNRVVIFDEDYIDKNIRLKGNSLDTIVILGPAVEIEDRLENAREELELEQAKYNEQKNKCDEYVDKKNVKSPLWHLKKIEDALRGDDNWSGRDKRIKGNKTNTAINENTYKSFAYLKPEKTRDTLINDFNYGIKVLEELKNDTSIIEERVPDIDEQYYKNDLKALKSLLSIKMEEPELSDREKRLFSVIENDFVNELENRKNIFSDQSVSICPFCFQALSPEYKLNLIEGIEKVLNKAVENYKEQLGKYKITHIDIVLKPFEKLSNWSICNNLIQSINEAISKNNSIIERKMCNPYEDTFEDIYSIENKIDELIFALDKLEKERMEYNDLDKRKKELSKELTIINNDIAYYDTKSLVNDYSIQAKLKHDEDALLTSIENRKSQIEGEIAELEAKKKDVRIALDSINTCIKYIFFEDNRLSLEYDGSSYKLLSRGKNVKPSDVSIGERNILALSYFFASILEGQDIDSAYCQDYLLIIDDPVSSYDFENRVGILSFLKYKLSLFLEGSINTKALIMTHDISTFVDLRKIIEDIQNDYKSIYRQYNIVSKFLELKDRQLVNLNSRAKNEYSTLIKNAYDYAVGNESNQDSDIAIGNKLRQILEAFGTFVYKKGIIDITNDKEILDLLEKEEYKSYFKNLMYRLVLHGGSHREEQIKSMRDYDFSSFVSEEELRRTAKDVLCFIYILNKKHIMVHLENKKNVESTFEKWCKDIQNMSMVVK